MAVFRHASQGVTVRNFWLCYQLKETLNSTFSNSLINYYTTKIAFLSI